MSLAHPAALRRLADDRLAADQPVYFVSGAGEEARPGASGPLSGLAFTPVDHATLQTRRAEAVPGRWPSRAVAETTALTVYRLTHAVPLPWRGDVGAGDLGLVGSGWLAPERLLDRPARWATGLARLEVPQLRCGAGRVIELRIRLASLRPDGLVQPHVALRAGDQLIQTVVPDTSGFREYAATLPQAVAQDACLGPSSWTLTSETFVPSRNAGLADGRTLGVAVDWIELASTPGR
jgi:hypothetical protein